ncbi:hypothetical protein K501DRAFT_167857 [Backusella circina FSU 941]|nr:hypothetical protein K501DRAFT_167857 [Backusella circina FSU 941]
MSFPTLPDFLRPGKDLMCKAVTRNPKVINIITKALNNTENDYLFAESEWAIGTRSDLVLAPKYASSSLPPIIVEFQHRVDKKFMKRAITYCIQASDRYGMDPILVVVSINSLSLDVTQLAKQSRVQGCYSLPCDVWASECFILCRSSIDECTLTEPLNPFIALGLFLMKSTASIIDMPWNNDETIKLLYNIAVEHYESVAGNTPHLIDILQQVLDEKDHECDNILKLLDNCASQEVLTQTIKSTKSRNQILKRKYSDINPTTSTSSSNRDSSPEILSNDTTRFIQSMEFVDNFKKTRIALGKKRMDWVLCLDQGKMMKLFDYKNAKTLQTQFEKYTKNKKK